MIRRVPKSAVPVAKSFNARKASRLLLAPAVIYLALFSIVPLFFTLWFSLLRYRLLIPKRAFFVGLTNYIGFITDPMFAGSVVRTLVMVIVVVSVSLSIGLATALLLNLPVRGRQVVRLLTIAPFFVMPTVSALAWKNLLMDPVSGVFAALSTAVGLSPVNWFSQHSLLAIIIVLCWEWVPFAAIILLTSLQSLDQDQVDAASLDGAGSVKIFRFITLPHLLRPMAIIALMETIFLTGVFAEILVTTAGGPGASTTNLTFMIYEKALYKFDVGAASAGGIIAVIFANIIIVWLARRVRSSIDQ
jgi:sorbitol/mannitol transport system permease protein